MKTVETPSTNEGIMKTLAKPSASYSITMRLKINNVPGTLGRITSRIGDLGGDIGAIDIAGVGKNHIIRDITVNVRDQEHGNLVVEDLRRLDIAGSGSRVGPHLLMHLGGKIGSPARFRSRLAMTCPWPTLRASRACAWRFMTSLKMSITSRSKAIPSPLSSDGTAVLGLGDIGPEAAMPVMEGKAMLFKEFAESMPFRSAWRPRTRKKSSGPSIHCARIRWHQSGGYLRSSLL